MKIYFTARSIPELANLSPDERMRAWRACYPKVFKHGLTWIALVLMGLCGAAGAIIGRQFGAVVWVGVGAALGGILGGFFFVQAAVAVARPYLRSQVWKREADE